ncbi:MAG: thrombospondin type 3 repeat-containing protein, partial [Candidatus Peribacteraceae bacterium]|nr:thrombospondin type 3 repeat-containing protein [Candidatus Peribacteraceae bacterium]
TLGTSSSDFQDAVLLLQFTQNPGSCADATDPRFKIEWERLENTGQGNAQKKAYVGQSAWGYGEGQWIPLFGTDGQVATDGGLTKEVDGLSVQRKNGNVRILAHGSLPGGSKEVVDARIVFDGAEVTQVTNDTGDDKTENPFDGVLNDGAGGDEVVVASNSESALFQTRVTVADDAVFIHWIQVSSSSSSSTSSTSSGQSSASSNDNDNDDGDGDDDDGIANNDEEDSDPCAAAYTVNNGRIILSEAADVSFRVLGSHATYGKNGPEVQVRMNVSTDGGTSWRSLFGFRDIDGGEQEYLTDLPSGSTVLLKAEGRRAWLFRQQTESGDGSGRIKIFRRKQSDPNTAIYATPTKLKSFLRTRLSSRKIMVGAKEALALIELQDLGTGADFQDAVVLLTIEKPASQGICGRGDDDNDYDSYDDDDDDSGSGSSDTGGTGDAGDTNPDIQICHFPPGNPRDHQTLTIPQSSWVQHAAHGDRRGECEGDEDGDGITNSSDLCPNTYVPEAVPTESMRFKRYALTKDSHIFRIGPRKKVAEFTLSDTKGCSCEQLIDVAEGKKSYRFTQYPRLKRQMRSLFPFYTRGARQSGCGKAILRMIQRNAN